MPTKLAPRDGVVRIYDTNLSVWEEHVLPDFEKRVWQPLLRHLRGRGWDIKPDPVAKANYPSIASSYKVGTKGVLELGARIDGRVIELELWSEDWPTDHPYGHKNDSYKRKKMPYATRLRTEHELMHLKGWLEGRYGYRTPKGSAGYTGWKKVPALVEIRHQRESNSFHSYVPDRWNAKAGDGGLLSDGCTVWVRGYDGRVRRGIAYYNLNSMWWVVYSKYHYTNMSSHELRLTAPEQLRRQCDPAERRRRLEGELSKAVSGMNYKRAEALVRALGLIGPLYRITKDHGSGPAWYRPVYRGYTDSELYAGLYTADEARDLVKYEGIKAIPVGDAPPITREDCKR